MMKIIKNISRIDLEALAWLGGLLFLALSAPCSHTHYTLCPFKNLGFNFCPGCGLGHSITYLFHWDLKESLHAHILGIPAVLILSYRTASLLIKDFHVIIKKSTLKGLNNG